jgi:hypothetical protein
MDMVRMAVIRTPSLRTVTSQGATSTSENRGSGVGADQDLMRVVGHVDRTVGRNLERHPGGWPGQSELALLDAVFSARASYGRPQDGGRPATGVHRVLDHWRSLRNQKVLDDLERLVATIDATGLDQLAATNGQRVPGRGADRLTKWEAVRSVAESLVGAGFGSSRPIIEAARGGDRLLVSFTDTPGVGKVTFDYFLVLLAVPGVKADTMVRAFIDEALQDGLEPGSGDETRVVPAQARTLLLAAADLLDHDPSELDHAAWLYQRSARRGFRSSN